VSKFV
jgi:hypothetical protein